MTSTEILDRLDELGVYPIGRWYGSTGAWPAGTTKSGRGNPATQVGVDICAKPTRHCLF